MNRNDKALWLRALRSGDYQQGRRRLRSGGKGSYSYCCLGVYLHAKGETLSRGQWRSAFGVDDDDDDIHQALADAGLCAVTEDDGSYRTRRSTFTYMLSKLNDEWRYPFTEIADWIEKHVPEEDAGQTRSGCAEKGDVP